MKQETGVLVVIVPAGGESKPWETLKLAKVEAAIEGATVDESVPPRVQTEGMVGQFNLQEHNVEAVHYVITRPA